VPQRPWWYDNHPPACHCPKCEEKRRAAESAAARSRVMVEERAQRKARKKNRAERNITQGSWVFLLVGIAFILIAWLAYTIAN